MIPLHMCRQKAKKKAKTHSPRGHTFVYKLYKIYIAHTQTHTYTIIIIVIDAAVYGYDEKKSI